MGFKMKGTVFSVNEAKPGPGGFSWGKQRQIGNAQDLGGFLKQRQAGRLRTQMHSQVL